MKYLLIVLAFASCLAPAVIGGDPKPSTPSGPICFGPPPEFQGVKITDTVKGDTGGSCAGYGYMPHGSPGPLCFHLVCQDSPCTEWTYRKDVCYDQPANEIKSIRYSHSYEDEDSWTYIVHLQV